MDRNEILLELRQLITDTVGLMHTIALHAETETTPSERAMTQRAIIGSTLARLDRAVA
jgi:hypothetical protein